MRLSHDSIACEWAILLYFFQVIVREFVCASVEGASMKAVVAHS
jgi:hypothetical protein